MKEQIQKKLNDSKVLRWSVLALVAFTMLCGYFLTDVMSPLKPMLEKELLWDSLDYGIFTSAYGWFNVFAFMLIIGGIILDKMGVRFTGMGACLLMVLGCGLKYYAISTTFAEGSTLLGMKTQVGLAALGYAIFGVGVEIAGITVSKIIVKWLRCPMELSTYFRINARNTGQFERTLIVADDDSYVSYLEGCTAPMRDENQLHAAIVEIVVHDRAEVKYSTVQNWYPGDAEGRGGVYNFVTKRGHCKGVDSKLSWTQVETGSAITWKYPSCILSGDNSTAEFYSVAVTNNHQQADTGTKMIHLGKNTRSTIVSKGISAGKSENSYRGLVRVAQKADNARNYSQCDSLLLGDKCGAHTFPYMDIHNETAIVEHEATTSKISEDQIFYCNQRGISTEDAVGLIVNGYAKEVLNKLPMEFAVEAQKLLAISLEGSVG